MPAIAFCELCEVDHKKQTLQWQSQLPLLPRKRHPEFAEMHGEDAAQEIVDDSWLVDRDGLPDAWLKALNLNDDSSLLSSTVDDGDSSLPSTVDQEEVQSKVDGNRSRSLSRLRKCSLSRSRSRSRRRWPTCKLLRQLLEPKHHEGSAHSMADLEVFSCLKRIAQLNVPIFSHLHEADPKDSIISLMLHNVVARFYIGATIDPVHRWLGGVSENGDRETPGHCQKWSTMYLLAISENAPGQPAAKQLEAGLIEFAQANWPETCTNKAADARGQCMGINFMYMVVYDGL